MMHRPSFTLLEVIVVVLLIVPVIALATGMSAFFIKHVMRNMERYNVWTQVSYTLDDMRARCLSAVSTTTPLTSGGVLEISTNTGLFFEFEGEKDIYAVTPDDTGDNVIYRYAIAANGDPDTDGSLVLETSDRTVVPPVESSEVLIEGRFQPRMRCIHTCSPSGCDEPNFITVNIEATSPKASSTVAKTEAIRFWFLDVVQ